ncbi:B-cell receptor CD22 B-lymphocyte cell adhesion molecule [Collichthys lucidus]|uniref:B-cell receptor CD22 n=1 Tax=Collichthys lucidus TaxID=240159 RepID=A0A4U5V569_COLLU|nr:B-cell receptor CD22 B-lymphocyte cell adhesion molecule [Collichthys lucidus]
MIAQIIGWFVFLALTKNFSHAQHEVKFKLVDQHQTAFVGSCAEIKCQVTYDLDTQGAYWFWMKDAVYSDANKNWTATIIYTTNDSRCPVSPDFQKREVKYIGSNPSDWKRAYSTTPKPRCSILICNLSKNDSGNYSVRFVKSATLKWKTTSDVNLTVIDNPCPITFVQKPPIVKESGKIELACSTLNSCPLKLRIQESTQPPWQRYSERRSNVRSLTASWLDDGKTYSCQTEDNKDPYLIQNITLNLEYAPKQMVAKIQPVNIREGQSVTLTCSAKGRPDPSFTWFKNDVEIYSGAQTWRIRSINDSQSGKYKCVAENKHGKLTSNQFTIDVKYAPRVEVEMTPRASEVIEGDEITLTCNVKRSNPRPTRYVWQKNQGYIGYNAYRFVKTVSPEDRGSYTCTATNSVESGTSEPLNIIVKYMPRKPTLSSSTWDNTVKVGGSITLTCATDANPPPSSYSWYRYNGNKLAVPQTDISTINQLILTNVQRTDEAQYMCNASNSIGTGEISMPLNLRVRYGPSNVVLSMDTEVKEGQLISITCTVESFPSSQLQLTNPTLDLRPSRLYRIKEESNFLQYTFSVTSAHMGLYTCRAKNEDGSENSTPRKLVVKYRPKDVKVQAEPGVTVNENTFLRLRCSANCSPKATSFAWMKMTDGKNEKMQDTRETVEIKSVSVSDTGQYSCEVSNEMGTGFSEKVEVKVKYAPKHAHIVKGAEQQDSDGTRFVLLSCDSQSYPPIKEYSWNLSDVPEVLLPRSYYSALSFLIFLSLQDWWNNTSLRSLRNDPITAEPFRSRDDLLPDQPCRSNAQRHQRQPDSTPASNIDTVYCTVKLPAGNTGPSAQKPVRQQGGNTEDDSLNYASINFGNKQKKTKTKDKVEDVYAAVSKKKPNPKKNGQEKHQDYENVTAADRAKSKDQFNYDTDASEGDVEITYTQVSFKAKPGHQRSNRDSSTSDEEETQYSDVKI